MNNNNIDITKISDIELMSLQNNMMGQFKQLETNLNILAKEAQRRIESHDSKLKEVNDGSNAASVSDLKISN